MSLKYILIALVLFIIINFSSFAQISREPIEVKEKGSTSTYFHNGTKLNFREMGKLMKDNATAYATIKSAQANNSAAQVFSFAGGFLIGMPIGTAIVGGEPNWTLAAVGAGLVVVSIPFAVNAKNKTQEAVERYNDGQSPLAKNRFEYSLNIQPTAMSLALRF